MPDSALIPIEEKSVTFYDDVIPIAVVDGKPYVPIRPITDTLGVSYGSQYNRIRRDDVLKRRACTIIMTAADGKQREMFSLPLQLLPGWLFGIRTRRVAPELQEKMTRYREECFSVLWEAFHEGQLTGEPGFNELLQTESPAVQTYKILSAMTKLARNQVLMEARFDSRLNDQARLLENYVGRLEQVEILLGDPEHLVTPAQATKISQAVKTVAMELSRRSGRNEYGGVYGELYRKFEIPSYRELPASRYDEAIEFLNNWLQSLISDVEF